MTNIQKMHQRHGVNPGNKCRDCCNIVVKDYAKKYYKCEAYGLGYAKSTDWRLKWDACGMFGRPFNPHTMRTLVEVQRGRDASSQRVELDGQVTF